MDDVEDAFQAFLDQLDLNENEERIIIDGREQGLENYKVIFT